MPDPTNPEEDRDKQATDLQEQIDELVRGHAGGPRGSLRDLADEKAAEHFRERSRRGSGGPAEDPEKGG